jgi:hypothetical protein
MASIFGSDSFVPSASKSTTTELPVLRPRRSSVAVPGVARDIRVKIASNRAEWEQAFRLAAASYRARGYEAANEGTVRFTPYHTLPDTKVFVATHDGQVVATLTYVPDNTLLGLPLESIFMSEIHQLRRSGRRLAEAISLADDHLKLREFAQVFSSLIKLAMQYHASRRGDTWVIAVNPRHRCFYTKVMGFVPLGSCRDYPLVQGAPAEAFMLDMPLMRSNAPEKHQEIFGEWLPRRALKPKRMPRSLAEHFVRCSTQNCHDISRQAFRYADAYGSAQRW